MLLKSNLRGKINHSLIKKIQQIFINLKPIELRMRGQSFGMNNLIPALMILAALSTVLAWYLTLYIIDAGYGYEANPFSSIIYDQPLLALLRNLIIVALVGYVAYVYSKKTKLAYIPVLLVAHIFFYDYVRDLTNTLLAMRLFT